MHSVTRNSFIQILCRTLKTLAAVGMMLNGSLAIAELGEPEKDELKYGFIKLTDMATIGEVLDVNLPRPRDRLSLAEDPAFNAYPQQVLRFLYEKQKNPAAKPKSVAPEANNGADSAVV